MFSYLKLILIVVLLLLFTSQTLWNQEDVTIENLIENIGEETFSSQELDVIEYYRDYPLNLRDVSAGELSQLPGISYLNAVRIIELVEESINISNSEICDILGLSPETEIILDNCTIKTEPQNDSSFKKIFLRSRYIDKPENVKGIAENKYLGSSVDLYNRLIVNYSEFEAGGLINKNAGEVNYNEFNSGYIKFDNNRTKVIVGDYYSDFGMGSLLWRQFSARKGSEVISPVVNLGKGINANRSSIDFAYFRGLSTQTILNLSQSWNISIAGFYSNRNKSATIDTVNNIATSIYTSGYYRTESEITKKNSLNEQAISANIEISNLSGFKFGTTILSLEYSLPVISQSSTSFSGKKGILSSLYTSYQTGNNFVASEFAIDANSNKIIKAGYIHNSKLFELSFSSRYIEYDFRSPFGYHFGEFSSTSNEKGLYAGLRIKPNRDLSISFFGDIFSTIGRTFTVPAVVKGIDLFAELNYHYNRKGKLSIRLRSDNKTDLFTFDNSNKLIGNGTKNSVRFELANEIAKNVNTRFRVEYTNYSNEFNFNNGDGFLSFLDIKWIVSKNLKLGARYTLFSTNDFNSAIYQYEYNIGGIMQTVALFGDGGRILLNVEYLLEKWLRIQINFANLYKNNTDIIGTGNEQIQSNSGSRITLQIEFLLK